LTTSNGIENNRGLIAVSEGVLQQEQWQNGEQESCTGFDPWCPASTATLVIFLAVALLSLQGIRPSERTITHINKLKNLIGVKTT
jgi:hypothetical protein